MLSSLRRALGTETQELLSFWWIRWVDTTLSKSTPVFKLNIPSLVRLFSFPPCNSDTWHVQRKSPALILWPLKSRLQLEPHCHSLGLLRRPSANVDSPFNVESPQKIQPATSNLIWGRSKCTEALAVMVYGLMLVLGLLGHKSLYVLPAAYLRSC